MTSECACAHVQVSIESVLMSDIHYVLVLVPHSPDGKKFRSKPQIERYLGGSCDLNLFDFSSREGTGETRRRTARERSVKPKVYTPRSNYSEERPLSLHPLRPSGPIRRTCGVIKLPVVWTPAKAEVPTQLQNGGGADGQDTPLGAIVQRLWERRLAMPVVTVGGYHVSESQQNRGCPQALQLVNGSVVHVESGEREKWTGERDESLGNGKMDTNSLLPSQDVQSSMPRVPRTVP